MKPAQPKPAALADGVPESEPPVVAVGVVPPKERVSSGAVLVPGGLCVTLVVPRPEGLAGAELAELAELTVEAQSPFPLEQLAWGYLEDARGFLRAFALPQARLGAIFGEAEAAAAESGVSQRGFQHVVPGWVPVALAEVFRGKTVLLADGGFLTVIPADPASPIRHRPLPSDHWQEMVSVGLSLGFRGDSAGLVAGGGLPADVQGGDVVFLRRLAVEVLGTGSVRCSAERWVRPDAPASAGNGSPSGEVAGGDGELLTWSLLPEALWSADLRSAGEVQLLQRHLRMSRLANGALWAWLGAAGVLLLLVIALGGLRWWQGQVAGEVLALTPAYQRATDNQQIIRRLRSVTNEPFEPFLALERLNRVREWQVVWIRSFSMDSTNEIELRGFANEINQVNAYFAALTTSGHFVALAEPVSPRREDRVEFTFRLRYVPSPREPVAAR